MRVLKKNKYYILGFLFAVALLVWWAVGEKQNNAGLRVIFFDVNQGDSILIEDAADHQILIDGGEGREVLAKLGKYLPFYDRSLDLVILTHPHQDHVAGLVEVLKRYRVEQVLFTGIPYDQAGYGEFKAAVKEKGIKFSKPHYGQRIVLAEGAFLDFLFPGTEEFAFDPDKINNTSIICRLVQGEQEYLFVGDAEGEVEDDLIAHHLYLQSDILKIGHHGSKTSSQENFLRAVKPKEAVISVGENKYNFPHTVVLERLRALGIEIKRTDLQGDIVYVQGELSTLTRQD